MASTDVELLLEHVVKSGSFAEKLEAFESKAEERARETNKKIDTLNSTVSDLRVEVATVKAESSAESMKSLRQEVSDLKVTIALRWGILIGTGLVSGGAGAALLRAVMGGT